MQLKRLMPVVLATLLLAGGGTFLVAQEQGAAQADAKASTAHGELVKVDTSAKTIAIKTDAGAEMQFSYTTDTRVSGAEQDVAGLATMSGTPVTIHFVKKDETNVATRIEVQKKP